MVIPNKLERANTMNAFFLCCSVEIINNEAKISSPGIRIGITSFTRLSKRMEG